jgi:hypothetical protein
MLTPLRHPAGAMMENRANAEEVEDAWRLLKLNWAVLAAMAAALAIAIAGTRFSIELADLLFSAGFVAVYAGFAHANARSPTRRDPQVMFALGATAQIVLITVIMAPLPTSWPLRTSRCRTPICLRSTVPFRSTGVPTFSLSMLTPRWLPVSATPIP